jgi:hypothetical protein
MRAIGCLISSRLRFPLYAPLIHKTIPITIRMTAIPRNRKCSPDIPREFTIPKGLLEPNFKNRRACLRENNKLNTPKMAKAIPNPLSTSRGTSRTRNFNHVASNSNTVTTIIVPVRFVPRMVGLSIWDKLQCRYCTHSRPLHIPLPKGNLEGHHTLNPK